MNCRVCAHQNPPSAKFCQECGSRLKRTCAGCGTDLPPGAKFCHECGQRAEQSEAAGASQGPVEPAAPESLSGGRYQVRRFIGEGAKKRVYLAHDTRLDRDVAVALIKLEGLDEAGRVRVRREAQAMGRLGDHPNIVTVHDIGEDDGRLFIVSQYMAGGDLERVLEQCEDRRLPIDETLRISTELCDALEYAHDRGVVHRDVNARNVWLSADGTAKLGDFGLAVSLDRSRLTQEGMMVGTVAYMAPEQSLGRPPDVRSDLYALGATMYELLTGRPPFLGDDAVAIISQHINTPPVAPSWHRKDVPEQVETLVLDLLEKDPERRPKSAAVIRERLQQVSSTPALREPVADTPLANPLDRLASGVFVGREEQLDQLREGVENALSGRGRVLLLVGEPGIGKTRTSEELATYARMRGAQVLWGRCYEGEGAPAYWPWLQIVRAYALESEPQTLVSEMGPGAADIAEVVSEVRERLPGLPTPPKLTPEQARFRLFDSITTFLRNAGSRQPMVLVLDDLHWADKPSLLLFQFVARELDSSRLLLVGTYRDVEVGRQHPLEQTLAELARMQKGDRVLLRGLADEDVSRFIELTTGHTPPRALVEAVYRETEGNPFFMQEVVRLLESDGRIEQGDSATSWSVEIPQGVRQVIGRRLNGLSEECNRVLTIGSAIGREFDLGVLSRVAELEEDAVLELLEQAEEARIIGEVEGTSATYRFSHALVRETLYGEIRTTRRVRMHRRIAEVIEERHAGRLEPHLAELAHHYCEAAAGGAVDKAVDYAAQAARRALESLAFEEAANHFERALIALEAGDPIDQTKRCELMMSRGDALFQAGLPLEARQVFMDSAALARDLESPHYFAIAVIGVAREPIRPSEGDADEVKLLEEALERLGDGYPFLRSRVLMRLAGRYLWMDDPERTRASAEEAFALGRNAPNPDARRDASLARTAILLKGHEVDELIATAQELLEGAVAEGDRAGEFAARANLLIHNIKLGERGKVEEQLSHRARLVEALRQPYFLAQRTLMEAHLALVDGRLSDARRLSWEYRTHELRVNAEVAAQVFGLLIYQMRRLQGRFGETEETLLAGVERYRGAHIWRCLLACMYAETGRTEQARAQLDHFARTDFDALRRSALGGPDFYALLSEACCACGDPAAAGRLYELLLPMQKLYIMSASWPVGSAGRSLGNLATLLGKFDDAERHFEDALVIDRRLGARGWLPRTQGDYARMLLVRSGPGDRERALELLDEAMGTCQELGLKGWLDRCIETKLAAQGVDSGSVQGSIHVIAASIGARRPDLSEHSAPDGTVTLMFSDMEGFTPMTERLGDLRAREITRAHNDIVREQLRAHGGHEVELQGDGFLLAFGSARRALQCAIAIQRAFAAYNKENDEPIRVRIGLHTGEALREQDKFFGRTVILASRIADQARGGEILASSLLCDLTRSTGDLRFGPARAVRLKGISDLQQLHEVEWR
jgi:class 3 adenylate cyclase